MNGVSVIICCYNSTPRLPETLKHLARQAVPPAIPWEVIVVNNASSDDTPGVAARVWQEAGAPAPLRVLQEPRPGKSFALDTGYATARYEVLVTVDDDNWLDANYLSLAAAIIQEHPEIGALGGQIAAAFEAAPPIWFNSLQSWYAVGPQGNTSGDITDYKCHVAGAGMVLRKSAYDELKRRSFGFLVLDRKQDQLTSGGDTELCWALVLIGRRIWYDERLRLTHYMPRTRLTKAYLRKMIRQADSGSMVVALYEMASSGQTSVSIRRYLGDVATRLGWVFKSAVKACLGRQHPFALELELIQLFRQILRFPRFCSFYRKNIGGVLGLARWVPEGS